MPVNFSFLNAVPFQGHQVEVQSQGGHVTGVGTIHGNVDIQAKGDGVSRTEFLSVVLFTAAFRGQRVTIPAISQTELHVGYSDLQRDVFTCVVIRCLILQVVDIKKLQGTRMNVSTERGALKVKAIYAESSCVSSRSGRVELGHVHGKKTTRTPIKVNYNYT